MLVVIASNSEIRQPDMLTLTCFDQLSRNLKLRLATLQDKCRFRVMLVCIGQLFRKVTARNSGSGDLEVRK